MFEKKYNIPVVCDAYIDLYNACNIGCKHCKFERVRCERIIKENEIDYGIYNSKKILICYSVDPYPLGFEDEKRVVKVIGELHKRNNTIVFLTRRAECLMQDLNIFSTNDWVGVSISEACEQNSEIIDIKQMYRVAKNKGVNTWMSLEPIRNLEFAEYIIKEFINLVDFIRVGKDDLNVCDWNSIRDKLKKYECEKVFLK
ncbi:MAG TPA: hypothetical protein DCP90_07785 [Clostridiales bacterium]|nr:MAG: hypothetical protein A2Y22_05980 [Clostridiales bacterium GWD2_32_59]HAN10499.1 hypothetical protein [Clostridiales bacterium]